MHSPTIRELEVPFFKEFMLHDSRIDPDCIWLVDHLLSIKDRPLTVDLLRDHINSERSPGREIGPTRLRRIMRQLKAAGYLQLQTRNTKEMGLHKAWILDLPSIGLVELGNPSSAN